jgi:hypothetical protein
MDGTDDEMAQVVLMVQANAGELPALSQWPDEWGHW